MSKLVVNVEVRSFDGIYLKRGIVVGGTKIDTYCIVPADRENWNWGERRR